MQGMNSCTLGESQTSATSIPHGVLSFSTAQHLRKEH